MVLSAYVTALNILKWHRKKGTKNRPLWSLLSRISDIDVLYLRNALASRRKRYQSHKRASGDARQGSLRGGGVSEGFSHVFRVVFYRAVLLQSLPYTSRVERFPECTVASRHIWKVPIKFEIGSGAFQLTYPSYIFRARWDSKGQH